MSTITVEEMNRFAESLANKKIEYAEAKEVSTRIGNELERMEDQMGKMLLELGQNSFRTPFGTMILTHRTSFKVPQDEENKTLFFNALKEEGCFEGMISVPYATMNAYLKAKRAEAEENGEDMVTWKFPGIEPPTISVIASLRKV